MADSRRTQTILCYALLLAVLVPVHVALSEYAADDAYIHLRIARNFVLHGEPYFDPGIGAMTTSAPVFTVVLALLMAITGPSVTAVAVCNAVCLCLAAWCGGLVLKRALGTDRTWVDLVATWLVVATCLESSVTLMETPLAMAVLLGGLALYQRQHAAAMVLLATAVFLRLELAAFLVVIFAHAMLVGQIPRRKVCLATIVGLFPWVAMELYYYHSLVPQTVVVKRYAYNLDVSMFVKVVVRYVFGPHWVFGVGLWLLMAIMAFMALLAVWLVIRSRGRSLSVHRNAFVTAALLLVPGLGIVLVYTLQRVLIFPWYVPLFTLPLVLGLGILALAGDDHRWRIAFGLLMLPATVNLLANLGAAAGRREWCTEFVNGARTQRYLKLVETLNAQYPGATLVSTEAGALGYAYSGPFIDSLGLVTPMAMKYYPQPPIEALRHDPFDTLPPQLVEDLRPDLIVAYDVFVPRLRASPVAGQYVWHATPVLREEDLAIADPRHFWFGDTLWLLVRRDRDSR